MSDFLLKIAICDDDEADRREVEVFLAQYLDKKALCAQIDPFSSGEAFLANDVSAYALVFLDIFMPRISGLETAKRLVAENQKLQIVFNSTSSEFAVESYDVEAMHYLVKPLEDKQFHSVMDKFFDGWNTLRTIPVKIGRLEEDIYLSDIIHVEAKGKKSIFHTKRGSLETSTSLAMLERLLPYPEFVRPIRYAIVATKEIANIPSTVLLMSDGTEIPISRNERGRIKKVFADYKWKSLRRRNWD